MKPCAPRDSASAAERSSILPENMTTGIAPTPGVLVDLLQHLPAVDLRHHHVEQDQVRRLLAQRGEPFCRARRLPDDVALRLEIDADVLAQALVVVDDQHDGPASLGLTPLDGDQERSRNWSRSARR